MRSLPPLSVDALRVVLPMSDGSADALADILLTDEPKEAVALLTECLAGDPPLVLWAMCQAGRQDSLKPRSLTEVAVWLHGRALSVLDWSDECNRPFDETDSHHIAEAADLVARAFLVADLAARLAASHGESTAEQAYLAGLVHHATDWFALGGAKSPQALRSLVPEWITKEGRLADAWITEAVDRASNAITMKSADWDSDSDAMETADPDLKASHQIAVEACRLWRESVDGPGRWLPTLTRKLARLKTLEHRFEETLEIEKLEALAEFAAGAGHEINNPLAIIGGRAQLLLMEETDPQRCRELALMNAQVKRAHEMIADMRLFARPPKPEPKSFDLLELVDSLIDDLSPSFAERAVSLSRTVVEGPFEIEADPIQCNVALRAMCKNSLEAIGRQGHIEIELDRNDQQIRIVLSDNGPGISVEHRRHLFDPFYSSRQAGRGLGLGLSKCWRIINAHGGKIEVNSEPNAGAKFTITLPIRFSQ